jgi:cytochrome c553
MNRLVSTVLFAALATLLVGGVGCGGGDKGGDTTPAATETPATDGADATDASGGDGTVAAGDGATGGGGLTEQLAQGDKVWADSCSTCHGDQGEGKGKKNPPLVGPEGLHEFKTGGDLYAYIKEKMPKDDPGSLSEADALATTAWLLSKNGKLGETSDAVTVSSAAGITVE